MERRAHPWFTLGLGGAALFLLSALAFLLRPSLLDAADAPLLGLGGAAGTGLATLLAWMGNVEVLAPALLVGALVLHRNGRTSEALLLLGAFAVEELLVHGLKAWVARPRPEWALVPAAGGSFPSGHAARGALAACLFVGLARVRGARLVAALAAWGAAMALSRVVLGVHHVSDVLAGMGAGVAVGGLGLAAFAAADERRRTVRVPVETPAAPSAPAESARAPAASPAASGPTDPQA